MIRKEWILPWLGPAALVGTALLIISLAPRFRSEAAIARDVSDVARLIQERYLEEVDPEEVRYGALEGMVDALDDPYSAFYRPAEALRASQENKGKFGGVGIMIQLDDHKRLVIVSTIEGKPAFLAGLMPGDLILAVDGTPTRGLRLDQASPLIKGEVKTTVRFTIERPEMGEPFEITVERGEIEIVSIRGTRIIDEEAGIGYVRLIQFQENSTEEFDDAIDRLQGEGMESLILDLRSNPGGVLKTAVDLASRFLPEDALIVSTVGRDRSEEHVVTEDPTLPSVPLIVLVNEGSASASEILAGAIQDHRRGLLLGVRTFGKGSVQSLISIGEDSSLLKITTAKYQTPSGRIIHREKGHDEDDPWGLIPDVMVPLPLEDFHRIRWSWGSRIEGLVTREPDGSKVEPPEEVPDDTQLDEALRLLRDLDQYRSLLAKDTPVAAELLPETAKGKERVERADTPPPRDRDLLRRDGGGGR